MTNLNLLFNKIYYEKLDTKEFDEDLKRINNEIFFSQFDHNRDYIKSDLASNTIVLKILYPGLLIGTGNPHGSQQSDEDINSGFSFDYVSGQPCIPGSSVKGALRSHFKAHPQVIKELLDNKDIDIKNLENEIFEGQDVFFDAVVFDGDSSGRLMDKDFITPHSKPTKNPVPIRIIKLLPDVRLEFRFKLQDGILKAEEKEALFSALLQIFGVGAKTNVGYGNLEEAGKEITAKQPIRVENRRENNTRRDDTRRDRNNDDRNNKGDNSEKIKCPSCGVSNFKYKRNGKLATECYKCNAPLN